MQIEIILFVVFSHIMPKMIFQVDKLENGSRRKVSRRRNEEEKRRLDELRIRLIF